MRGAVIDLGTNTFNLLIFQGDTFHFEVIYTDKSFVNIGAGGINNNTISTDALERAFTSIEKFVEICKSHQIDTKSIKAFGTSALRNANNSGYFMEKVANKLGVKIMLINGLQEAEFVFEAVNRVHPFCNKKSCIIDIGGGSTEFIFTNKNKVDKFHSFKIGLSRLLQFKELADPLSKEDIADITSYLENQVQDNLDKANISDLIGTGGSFETYYHLIYQTYDVDFSRSYLFLFDELMKTLDYLIQSSTEERSEDSWIIDFRVPMINIAALKTKWILSKIEAERCFFSPASLKEGLALFQFKK